MYRDYIFEWRNEKHENCRFCIHTDDKSYAWFKALQQCGWSQRTSLGLVGNNPALGIRDGIVMNWWDVCREMYHDKELKNFCLATSGNMHDMLASGFYKITAI